MRINNKGSTPAIHNVAKPADIKSTTDVTEESVTYDNPYTTLSHSYPSASDGDTYGYVTEDSNIADTVEVVMLPGLEDVTTDNLDQVELACHSRPPTGWTGESASHYSGPPTNNTASHFTGPPMSLDSSQYLPPFKYQHNRSTNHVTYPPPLMSLQTAPSVKDWNSVAVASQSVTHKRPHSAMEAASWSFSFAGGSSIKAFDPSEQPRDKIAKEQDSLPHSQNIGLLQTSDMPSTTEPTMVTQSEPTRVSQPDLSQQASIIIRPKQVTSKSQPRFVPRQLGAQMQAAAMQAHEAVVANSTKLGKVQEVSLPQEIGQQIRETSGQSVADQTTLEIRRKIKQVSRSSQDMSLPIYNLIYSLQFNLQTFYSDVEN